MKFHSLVAAAVVILAPSLVRAQHSHGGGMDVPPRQERRPAQAPERQAGVLPPGSARQIQVLVVSFGFSPKEIPVEQGEEVVLAVRRSNPSHCAQGLAIQSREIVVELPLDQTVPVSLRLDRAERIAIGCVGEDDVQATIVVAAR